MGEGAADAQGMRAEKGAREPRLRAGREVTGCGSGAWALGLRPGSLGVRTSAQAPRRDRIMQPGQE